MQHGDIIGGRYRLERKIGQGGAGRIWLAQDSRLDRHVAIKFLLGQSPMQRARLAKRVALEAKIAASIQHRNVVQMFDFGTHDADIPYIVMEALSGVTLGEAFDAGQRFSLDQLIDIMGEVLRGLSAVHDAGIVHRDLKPENIFLVRESRGKLSPKLLDFGISRSLEPETRSSAVTTTEGLIVGTPEYMSPEQARGDSDIDKRTDIYSIGVILFEAFSGTVPFPSRSITERLIAVIQRAAPPLAALAPAIGPALCAVVDKALAKKRERRYAHAEEMLDAVVAASYAVPEELDRDAPLFPPEVIRDRLQLRAPNVDESLSSAFVESSAPLGSTGYSTPETVDRRAKRPYVPPADHPAMTELALAAPTLETARTGSTRQPTLQRTLWLVLTALAVVVAAVAVFALIDQSREPEGSGLIVVQAPGPAAAAVPAAEAPPPAEEPAASPGLAVEATGSLNAPAARKAGAARARKPAAEPDPMQLKAASVAEAFSKQKAGVIECLNQHASDVEHEPQLKVRLSIDRDGVARDAVFLPASISNKPVAACMKAAVTKMSFPQLEQPTTFNVPLLWRRM